MSWSRLGRDRLLIVVPTVIGVLGLVTGLVLAFVVPRVISDDWSQEAKAASAAAEDFVVAFNTYDAAELDDYRERVAGLVTEPLQEVISANLDEAEELLVQDQRSSGGVSVRSIGITELDEDSATAIVVFTVSLRGGEGQPVVAGSRTFVELARSGSAWKVNDYTEIPLASAEAGAPEDTTPAPETEEVTP